MELYMMNRQHGRMILESVENDPLGWPTIEENGVTRPRKYSELTLAEAIQADCDVKAINIILQGLPQETFLYSRFLFDNDEGLMIHKYFIVYTKTDVQLFHDILLQHMESLKESIQESAKHKREYDRMVNDKMMQSKERKDNSSKALDDGLAMVEVQLSAKRNILANEQQHSEQSEFVYDTYLLEMIDRNITHESTDMSHRGGEIDQIADAKNTYKYLSDSIKKTSVQTKDHADSLIVQLNYKSVENADLKAQIQENVFANASLKNKLRKIKGTSVDTKNSSKKSYASNDMTHKYYLEEAKKKTQERYRKSTTSVMPFAKSQNTTKSCKSKPKGNSQTSRVLPTSKSSCPTTTAMPKADHSRKSSPFFDFKHFVCSACQKCVFSANHDVCITKLLKEVNYRVKIQSLKTRDSTKPVEPTSHT
nr:hypothetical protein [Tanacetum cinerariifolium]